MQHEQINTATHVDKISSLKSHSIVPDPQSSVSKAGEAEKEDTYRTLALKFIKPAEM